MNTRRKVRNSMLLVLTAFIWGIAFVAQSKGGDEVGPYSFNCIRSMIGGVVLLPVIRVLDQMGISKKKPVTYGEKNMLLVGGVCCGIALFIASTLQQLGIYYGAEVGKAGFLTACYILIVPLLALYFKKKCGWNIWVAVMIALAGLYLLCMQGSFVLQKPDILLLLCAFCFSVQILLVDHFSPKVDGVRMSAIQFFTSGVLGIVPMFLVDMKHSFVGFNQWIPVLSTWNAWLPILYAGVLSCGVAYTLQIIGQNGLNPTVASLIMSLESVFSVHAGWILLGQKMSGRELTGCGLIFAAIVMAQIPHPKRRQSKAKFF